MGRAQNSHTATAAVSRRAEPTGHAPSIPGQLSNLQLAERLLSRAGEKDHGKLLKRLPMGVLGGERNRFSVTELETYQRCPAGWFAGHVLGARQPFNARAQRGSILHGILQRALELAPDQHRRYVREQLREAVKARKLSPADAVREAACLQTVLGRYAGPAWPFSEHHQELRLRSEKLIPGAALTARTDRIDIGPDGGALVVDYKNGRVPKPRDRDERLAELQRYLYPLLAAEHLNTHPLGTIYIGIQHGGHDGSLTAPIPELASVNVDCDWSEDSAVALGRARSAVAHIGQADWETAGGDCPPWCTHDLIPAEPR